MYFLSIESSSKAFAVSVSKDDQVLRQSVFSHAAALENVILKNIDTVLAEAKVAFAQLDAFVVSLGPGSFTSLRVGLSTVKAFCMATGKPMAGVPTLDVIAHGAVGIDADEVCVVCDARRGLVYSAIFKCSKGGQLTLSGKYRLSPMEEVLERGHGRTLFTGDALALVRTQIEEAYARQGGSCRALFAPQKLWGPQVHVLAGLGYERLTRKKFDDPARIIPLYLYEDDCQVDGGRKPKDK